MSGVVLMVFQALRAISEKLPEVRCLRYRPVLVRRNVEVFKRKPHEHKSVVTMWGGVVHGARSMMLSLEGEHSGKLHRNTCIGWKGMI